ncbi:hypothetical protein MUP77_11410 [Candidatus Bathyarchaeota archaeon]|nr:hypothetical protein [Candidatus Bathyarchaeota archaeon]
MIKSILKDRKLKEFLDEFEGKNEPQTDVSEEKLIFEVVDSNAGEDEVDFNEDEF